MGLDIENTPNRVHLCYSHKQIEFLTEKGAYFPFQVLKVGFQVTPQASLLLLLQLVWGSMLLPGQAN